MKVKGADGIEFGINDIVECVLSYVPFNLQAGVTYVVDDINIGMGGIRVRSINAYITPTRFKLVQSDAQPQITQSLEPISKKIPERAEEVASLIVQAINSSPRTPTKQEITRLIAYGMSKLLGTIP